MLSTSLPFPYAHAHAQALPSPLFHFTFDCIIFFGGNNDEWATHRSVARTLVPVHSNDNYHNTHTHRRTHIHTSANLSGRYLEPPKKSGNKKTLCSRRWAYVRVRSASAILRYLFGWACFFFFFDCFFHFHRNPRIVRRCRCLILFYFFGSSRRWIPLCMAFVSVFVMLCVFWVHLLLCAHAHHWISCGT